MRKVTVHIPEVHMSGIDLDVEDNATDAEILLMANEMHIILKYEASNYNDTLEYSHTMDIDKWDIEWHKKED